MLCHFPSRGVLALAMMLLASGCSDNAVQDRRDRAHHHHHHAHDHDDHDLKIFSVGDHFKPCHGGLHENGVPASEETVSRVTGREVVIPELALRANLRKEGVFYYAVVLPDPNDTSVEAVVGCSPDIREIVAWSCHKDKSFDGASCELEFSEGETRMNEFCVQTNMALSGLLTRCDFDGVPRGKS